MILFGSKIKELRKQNRYTQLELATLLGVTKSTIASYENDSRQPSYEVLVKLADIFHVSIDTILLNRSSNILEIDHLKEEQIKILKMLIETFQKSNLIDDAIDMDSTALIDMMLKFKKLSDIETKNALKNLK